MSPQTLRHRRMAELLSIACQSSYQKPGSAYLAFGREPEETDSTLSTEQMRVPPHSTDCVLCSSSALLPLTSAPNSRSHPPHLGISALHRELSRLWAQVMQKRLQDTMPGYHIAWLSLLAEVCLTIQGFFFPFPDRSHFCPSTMSQAS